MDNGTSELLNSHESTWTVYQPYAWRFGVSGVGGGPYPIFGRVGTPGADIVPACNRIRGVRAQTDPLTGESFMVGSHDGSAYGGILQVSAQLPRNTGSLAIDPGTGVGDAASPIPEPATLMLLLGMVPLLRRRR